MKLRVINAVEYDATQMRLLKARWRLVDTVVKTEEPDEIVDASQIIQAIKAGEKVTTVFFVDEHQLQGPLVELAMYGHGNESIVIPNPEHYEDKRVRNLPRL